MASSRWAARSDDTFTAHSPAIGFRIWRPKRVQAMRHAHTHPDIELNWLLEGRVEYIIAGRRAFIEAGQLGVFWGGVPHQSICNFDIKRGVWITVPLAWFLGCRFSNQLATHIMSGHLLTQPFPAERAEQWLKDFTAGRRQSRLVLLELEAVLERMALGAALGLAGESRPAHLASAPSPQDTKRIDSITSFLAANYREPLSIADIASHAGLHPKHLMTIFRKSTGMTVKRYLMGLRLAHAQRLLTTSKMHIIDIAMESGFGSLNRFYVAFSRHTGERPLKYRKLHAHDAV
jgi:AraC family transcriptional regulator, melibiose operon regulatory protein